CVRVETSSSNITDGQYILVTIAISPIYIDDTEYGINNAVLIDNEGIWRDEDGLQQHLQCPGIERVILTAPGKGEMKNIVHGVNNDIITDADKIISAASCTTNAIVPPLTALEDKLGIVVGHVETVHASTNDQNLLDN